MKRPSLCTWTPLLLCALSVESTAGSLQEAIDAAAPGEVVLVDPGDYPRPLVARKAITIRPSGPGVVRFASLTGSACRVEDIVFDGRVGSESAALVVAGDGLTLSGCTITTAIQGLLVETGAAGVTLESCLLEDLITGIELEPGVQTLDLFDTAFENCTRGLLDDPDTGCPEACGEAPCGTVRIRDCRFEGGELQIRLEGGYAVEASGSLFSKGGTAISLAHGALALDDCDVLGDLRQGTGLLLDGVSGSVVRCRVASWKTAIRVTQATCGASALVLGGSLSEANDLVENNKSLRVEQPEPVQAEYNYWGTIDCLLLRLAIDGLSVEAIVDAHHFSVYFCPPTPVQRTSWGRLRVREGGR